MNVKRVVEQYNKKSGALTTKFITKLHIISNEGKEMIAGCNKSIMKLELERTKAANVVLDVEKAIEEMV